MRPARAVLTFALCLSIGVAGSVTATAAPADARDAGAAAPVPALKPPSPAVAAPGAAAQLKPRPRSSKDPKVSVRRVAEMPGKRSASAKRYRMSDGSVEAELYPTPVHYRDKAGRWQTIDTRVERSERSGFAFSNTTNRFESHFGTRSDRLVSFETDGTSILLGTPGAGRAVTPSANGHTVTYRDLFGAADVRYQIGSKALKEEIVLAAPPRQASYRFTLRLKGLQAQAEPDGSIGFYRVGDTSKRPAFVMPKPFMTDSAPDASSPYGVRWSDKVTQKLARRGADIEVTLTADQTWLADKRRVYPVAIDPTIAVVPDPAAGQDTMIYESSPTTNYGLSGVLNVGNAATGANSIRSLLKFDLSQLGIPSGTTIRSASLDMYFSQPHTSETVDVGVEARKVTAPWTETTATWANINTSYYTASLPYNYVQVDDEDESRVQSAGPWLYSPGYTNSLNGGLHYLPIGTTPDTFTWNANISDAGNYRVDAYYTAYTNRGTPTYTVTGDTGTLNASVNQTTGTSGTGYWATLGTQHFAPGKPATVTMTRGATSSSPVADAVRFVEAGTQVKLATQRDAWHSFAVGNVVQDWVRDPTTNFGLMVKASNEAAGIGGPSYQASEDLFGGETTHRPRLVIQYNEPSVPFAVPTKVNPTGAELSWGDYIDPSLEDGDDLVEFLIYRGCVTLADTTCVNPAPTYFGTSPPAGVELLATLPNDVHSYIDTTATASSASVTASYRYWVIARTKDGTQSPSVSQLVQMPRPGRVLRVLTGDIADTTIANATAYQGTNLPAPDGYNRTLPGNNHTTYGDTRALLDFDTSAIPARVKVMSSELQLWKSTAPGSGATFDLHELTRDFTESQATWLKANSTTNWTAPGGDYNPAALASLTTGGTPTRLTWKDQVGQTAKFTPAIQRWVDDPAANHGLLIKARDESLSQQRIGVAAGEFAEPALRPRLLVEYLEKSTTGTYYAPEIPDRVAPNTTLSVPVTITNTTGTPWSAMRLSYRWMIGTTDDADEGDRLFTTVRDLEPGESQTIPDVQIRVAINSTTGSKRIEYRLELELINAQGVWLSQSGSGIQPLQQPVLVEDPILTKELGLEKFFAYSGENTGSGSTATANLHTGDVVFNYDPIRNPSRGAATFLRLSHDGADLTSTAAGHGWSVQASTATRIGRASMIFDTEKVPQTPYPRRVYVIDGDGTGHQYTFIQPDPQNPATWRYDRPAGVHLDLRFDPNASSDRAWSLTRPDGTRFYFEDTGGNSGAVQRYIVDRNGNQTTFTYGAQYGDTPLLTSITDPDARITLTLTYVTGSSRLHRVTDLSAHRTLRFIYSADGETLTELRDGGNYDPVTDTYGTPPKVFQFGYTAEGRLSSVKDPLNGETRFTYYATPWAGRVQTLTDRRGKVTEFSYADPGGTADPAFETTVTGVLVEGGTTKRFSSLYTTDAFGRPTAIRNANNETTKLGWDRDNNVVRMEEANHAVTTWVYEQDSGYPTSIRDAQANKNGTAGTSLSYVTMPGSATTAPVRVLTAKTSPQGRTWQFSYDTKGNLKTVTDPLGVASPTVGDYQTSYDYNAYGQLTHVHDANGNPPTVYNDFDANGYPRTITDPLGNLTRFVYDDWGQVVKVTDARGKDTTAEYDVWGRPTKQSLPLDAAAARFQTTQTTFDLNDNVTRVIAPNGAVTTATYNAADEQETSVLPSNGATGERKISYSYDDLGRLAQQTAPQGNLTPADPDDFVTRYSYDPIGQLTGVVTPFDGASSYKTTYVYDTVGNLLKEIDPRKNDTPDPNDFTVQMVYDLNHRPITSINAAGYAVRTQYDRDGLVTAQLDADGNKKSFTLDGRGMATQISVPHTPTGGARVQRTTRYFYDENGNQTKVENPRGVATTASATDFLTEYLYDANNRVVQRKAPFDSADPTYKTPASTFYEYDSVGNLSRQSEPTYATTKATARDWSTFTWFDNGLARTGTDPWGIATTYDYNELGLQTSRTLTSAAGDAARTMAWQFWPDGSQRARSDTAPLGGLHEVLVDNSDVQNTQVTGTWATGTAAATKVGYDYRTHAGATGSTDSFTWKLRVPSAGTYEVFARCPQGAGTATSAVYTVQHSAGSTARTVNQSTCTAGSPWVSLGSYSYAEGVDKKVTLAVPASGTVVADAIKMVRAGSSPGVAKDFTYSYDVNGQLTSIGDNTTGALTDTYEIRYDGLRRVDRVRELAAGVARSTTTYGYDPNSNLASWFLDDHVAPQTDRYAGYTYDVRDLLETVRTGSSPSDPALKTTSYTYTSRGQRATETKPNGNKVTYRYIEDGLLRSQVENRYVGDAATLVSSHSLAYSLDGHRSSDVSKVASADTAGSYLSQTASFAYTPDNRLRTVTKTGADPGSNEAYAYDAPGNVTAQTIAGVSTKYRFDRNRLLCAGPTVDPAGTSCAAGSIEYNYDPFGRLDTVTSADRTVERYTYDGFDRTVSHRKYDPATGAQKSVRNAVFDPLDRTVQESTQAGTNPAKTTTFTYLGLSEQVVSEEQPDPAAGGAPKTTASYTYGPTGERISQTKTPLAGGTSETSYYGLNPHTDVETLTSETGTARSTYRYTGYGSNDASGFTGKDKATATGGPEVEAYNPYRFNSKRWDPATGSYDMGFRDYSPGLNRFLTRDMYNGAFADLRLGTDPWLTNRYAFAGGNPITGIEVDGHYDIDDEGNPVRSTLSAHDSAVMATADKASEWMEQNDFEGEVTVDVGEGGRTRNYVRGGAKDGLGGDGYADLIIWGRGKDEGVIYVYEIKPANEYGLSGVEQLDRYIKKLQEMYPSAIVRPGPDLKPAPFTSREGSGRVWSGLRRADDKQRFTGMRWYGMDKRDPAPTPTVIPRKQHQAEDERRGIEVNVDPQAVGKGIVVGVLGVGLLAVGVFTLQATG